MVYRSYECEKSAHQLLHLLQALSKSLCHPHQVLKACKLPRLLKGDLYLNRPGRLLRSTLAPPVVATRRPWEVTVTAAAKHHNIMIVTDTVMLAHVMHVMIVTETVMLVME